jgi:hypothetical protein
MFVILRVNMIKRMSTATNYKRALAMFLMAYIAITVVAFWFYLLLVWINGAYIASAATISKDPLYLLAEKYYPLLNLCVWTLSGWLYFRKSRPLLADAWRVSLLWLAIVLPLDLVTFVLVKNPLSLSAHDFYIGQFPWIYLTYAAVILGPICGALIAKRRA